MMMRRMQTFWVALTVWLAATPLTAQTLVINPTTVVFIASSDHDRQITVGGQTVAVVTRYELRIYLDGATSPISTVDLGKPTPDASREIRLQPAELIGLPLGAYQARVAALGPGGEGVSDPTPPFARVAAPTPPTNVSVRPGS